jgi:hypothetical protein
VVLTFEVLDIPRLHERLHDFSRQRNQALVTGSTPNFSGVSSPAELYPPENVIELTIGLWNHALKLLALHEPGELTDDAALWNYSLESTSALSHRPVLNLQTV